MQDTRPVVVLVGPPAAGKSRIGKRVAKIMGVPFLDTDSMVVAEHGPIVDIFDTHGEAHFRALERDAVLKALGHNAVVALGGGAIIDPDTRSDLKSLLVVLVTISEDAVSHRLGTGKRPLLTNGLESWKNLVSARAPWYEEVATVTFDTSHQSIDHVAEQVALWLEHGAQQ
jgi:shikimate kinase